MTSQPRSAPATRVNAPISEPSLWLRPLWFGVDHASAPRRDDPSWSPLISACVGIPESDPFGDRPDPEIDDERLVWLPAPRTLATLRHERIPVHTENSLTLPTLVEGPLALLVPGLARVIFTLDKVPDPPPTLLVVGAQELGALAILEARRRWPSSLVRTYEPVEGRARLAAALGAEIVARPSVRELSELTLLASATLLPGLERAPQEDCLDLISDDLGPQVGAASHHRALEILTASLDVFRPLITTASLAEETDSLDESAVKAVIRA